MGIDYTKDYYDLHDVRKAIKDGRIRLSQHAQYKAATKNIDISDYLDCLSKMPPIYDKSYADRDEGLPGFRATVRNSDGKMIVGAFVQSNELGQSEIIVVKTVFEYDPYWGKEEREQYRDAFPQPTLDQIPVSILRSAPQLDVMTHEKGNSINPCSSCISAKMILGRTICGYHTIYKMSQEGITTKGLDISDPSITSCDGFIQAKVAG